MSCGRDRELALLAKVCIRGVGFFRCQAFIALWRSTQGGGCLGSERVGEAQSTLLSFFFWLSIRLVAPPPKSFTPVLGRLCSFF